MIMDVVEDIFSDAWLCIYVIVVVVQESWLWSCIIVLVLSVW